MNASSGLTSSTPAESQAPVDTRRERADSRLTAGTSVREQVIVTSPRDAEEEAAGAEAELAARTGEGFASTDERAKEQVTVTGSRVRRIELETTEPVTTTSKLAADALPGYRQDAAPDDAEIAARLDALGDDPDNALARIAELHESGERETARRLLDAFLERHPDHVLPDDYPLADPRVEAPASPPGR